MKIVYLKWTDSNAIEGWIDTNREKSELSVIETVGYLLYEDEKETQVAHSLYSEKQCTGFISIPTSVIIERRIIVEADK